VENGLLVITTGREDLSTAGLMDCGGQRYSSARLITRDTATARSTSWNTSAHGRRRLGRPDGVDDTAFPVRMEIDYVRVYQP
jgi:hypothetical protein